MDEKLNHTKHINKMIGCGRAKLREHRKLLQNKWIPLQDKLTVLESMVRSVLTFGSELVEPTPAQFKKMDSVLAQGLRWIQGCGKYSNASLLFEVVGWLKSKTLFEKRKASFHRRISELDDDRAVKRVFNTAVNEKLLVDRSHLSDSALFVSNKELTTRDWRRFRRTSDYRYAILSNYNKPSEKRDKLLDCVKNNSWLNYISGGWAPKVSNCVFCDTQFDKAYVTECEALPIDFNIDLICDNTVDLDIRRSECIKCNSHLRKLDLMGNEIIRITKENKRVGLTVAYFDNEMDTWCPSAIITNEWCGSKVRVRQEFNLGAHENDLDFDEEIKKGALTIASVDIPPNENLLQKWTSWAVSDDLSDSNSSSSIKTSNDTNSDCSSTTSSSSQCALVQHGEGQGLVPNPRPFYLTD